jgi:putative restriction endonuclease
MSGSANRSFPMAYCFPRYTAAFDAHLIGIDADYRLHVSERLLGQHDGPMLDAPKGINGVSTHLPNRMRDRLDRDRLALRFDRFKAVA